jgi:hypothetical protein
MTQAVGAQLVRDVFVAVDEMHEHAMEGMGGNTQEEEDPIEDGDVYGDASMSQAREGNTSQFDSMEAEPEGTRTKWNFIMYSHAVNFMLISVIPILR